MFSKIAITLSALAVAGAAALALSAASPASADTWRNHRPNHHHWRPAIRYSYPTYGYSGSCYVERIVHTPYGPRVTYVNVCS